LKLTDWLLAGIAICAGASSASAGDWVTVDPYPPEALAAKAHGSVIVQFMVGTDGVPHDCSIARSSGLEVLDKASCALAIKRARYKPIESPSKTTLSFLWILPNTPRDEHDVPVSARSVIIFGDPDQDPETGKPKSPRPYAKPKPDLWNDVQFSRPSNIEKFYFIAIATIDLQGKVQACEVKQSSGSTKTDSELCSYLSRGKHFSPPVDENGKPGVSTQLVTLNYAGETPSARRDSDP
jgi:TonB family protein